MNRCGACGSAHAGTTVCPRCGASSPERRALTDGGERESDEEDEDWSSPPGEDTAEENRTEDRESDRPRWERRSGDRWRGHPRERRSNYRPPGEQRDYRSDRRSPEEGPGDQHGEEPPRDSRDRGRETDRRSRERDEQRRRGGNQYRERQDRNPRGQRPPQGGQAPGNSVHDDQEGAGDSDGSGESRLGRREFLLGGVGVAGLAGGGWWFFLRGYDGAKGVVQEYIGALDSNDWGAVGDLYHDDSEFARMSAEGQVDGYEEYLSQSLLERWEATDIAIEELYEVERIEEVEQRDGLRGFDAAEHDVTEFKDILAVVSEDRTGWDGLDPEADARRKVTYRHTTAKTSGGDWAIWWARLQ